VFFLERRLGPNENIVYKLKKRKKSLLFTLLFVPFWFALCLSITEACFSNWFMGGLSFNSLGAYLVCAFFMGTFVPLMTIILLNYLTNNITATDQRLFVRTAVSGTLLIINLEDIHTLIHERSNLKGFTLNYIKIYMNNGKVYKTGNLFISPESLDEFKKIFKDKMGVKKGKQHTSAKEFKSSLNLKKHKNIPFLLFYYAPFMISITMFLLLFTGVNSRFGEQTKISLHGTISQKNESYQVRSGSTIYTITINNGQKKYELIIDKDEYTVLNIDDNVSVSAKKGSLGIVYDQVIHKIKSKPIRMNIGGNTYLIEEIETTK